MHRVYECELDEELNVLFEMVTEKFGDELPVIFVHETHNDSNDFGFRDEDYVAPNYDGDYSLDLAKLKESGDRWLFEFRYVAGIIEDAITGQPASYTSRKYSFGDTPGWWETLAVDSTEGRKVLNITALVG